MLSEQDDRFMQRALELAHEAMFTSTPNPRVGCVIVRQGRILGEGFTQPAGQAHAEVMALRDAVSRHESVKGATVYVTLEPCSHFGRTPPCVHALIEAQVGRVVAAMQDPNPLVAGKGLQALRDAGIEVRCGLHEEAATELNIGFVQRMLHQRPWVRMKAAISLDGYLALPDGQSQWITSQPAREDAHAWRARACAVLTGIGTVKADDPWLTVRAIPTARQPLRVLIDSRLEVSQEAKLLKGGALIYCAVPASRQHPDKVERLKDMGCEIVELPNAAGKVDLAAVLKDLAARQINELHVEAGGKLNSSLLREACVNELLIYQAPLFLYGGQALFEQPALAQLADAPRWEFLETQRVGVDLRHRLRLAQREVIRALASVPAQH